MRFFLTISLKNYISTLIICLIVCEYLNIIKPKNFKMNLDLQVIDCGFKGFKSLKGKLINGKYTVGSCIGTGCFGCVFKIIDSQNVIKISTDTEMMANEIKSLNLMQKQRKSKGVTRVIDYGLISLTNF